MSERKKADDEVHRLTYLKRELEAELPKSGVTRIVQDIAKDDTLSQEDKERRLKEKITKQLTGRNIMRMPCPHTSFRFFPSDVALLEDQARKKENRIPNIEIQTSFGIGDFLRTVNIPEFPNAKTEVRLEFNDRSYRLNSSSSGDEDISKGTKSKTKKKKKKKKTANRESGDFSSADVLSSVNKNTGSSVSQSNQGSKVTVEETNVFASMLRVRPKTGPSSSSSVKENKDKEHVTENKGKCSDQVGDASTTTSVNTKPLKRCRWCDKEEPSRKTFKKCARCRDEGVASPRFYCGKDCQISDWHSKHRMEHKNKFF